MCLMGAILIPEFLRLDEVVKDWDGGDDGDEVQVLDQAIGGSL